jgi:hypothetical protein
VFVDEVGGHLDDTPLRRRFHEALDRAGLQRLRLHDLRHTFGTLAVQVWPLSDVKAYMGHADISTTMIYVHHVPQVDAADRLSRLVSAAEGAEVATIPCLTGTLPVTRGHPNQARRQAMVDLGTTAWRFLPARES